MTEREFFKRGRGRGFENQGGCSIEIERRFKNASLNHEVAAPRIPRCTLDLTEFCVETSDRLNLRNGPPLDILKRGGFVPSALVFFSLSLFFVVSVATTVTCSVLFFLAQLFSLFSASPSLPSSNSRPSKRDAPPTHDGRRTPGRKRAGLGGLYAVRVQGRPDEEDGHAAHGRSSPRHRQAAQGEFYFVQASAWQGEDCLS